MLTSDLLRKHGASAVVGKVRILDRIENHMVALPQPELEHEPECDHSDIQHLNVECFGDGTYIDFRIRCCDCGAEGYRLYTIKEWSDDFDN